MDVSSCVFGLFRGSFLQSFLDPRKQQKTFEKVCRPRFIALLLRVPCTPVLQTTASVMPERSKPPNLALKRNAKSHVSLQPVIWHYVLRRDLEVLNSPALRWLWFGAQECTAPEGEGR